MSVKKKKEIYNWAQCDTCKIILSEKDVAAHGNDCPPNETGFTYPYILNGAFKCALDVINNNDVMLTNIPEDELEKYLFLSVATLQLCSIPIGENAIIEAKSGMMVRKVWKGHDRRQLTAAISENDPYLAAGEIVKITRLPGSYKVAREIIIESLQNCSEHILRHLQHTYQNRIFKIGNKIIFYYFGQKIEVEIVKVIFEEPGLAEEFFGTLFDTIWTVSKESEEKKPAKPLAGLENLKVELDFALFQALQEENENILQGVRGILLYGPSGTGKTSLMKSASLKWSKNTIEVSLVADNMAEYLNECFLKATLCTPSIIAIDDIDLGFGVKNYQMTSALSAIFEKIHNYDRKIVIMATTSKINDLDPILRRAGRFDKELELPVPTPVQRLAILRSMVAKNEIKEEILKAVAYNAHGFVGADLEGLLTKAMYQEGDIGTNLLKCLPKVRPSAMKEIMIQVPNVRWEDIGGQHKLKHQLKQAVEWPLKYPKSFLRLGVHPPRGVLMYGPPGCSKTMIAKALATESGLNFLSVKGPELFNKWVGESEKAVREVFRRARLVAPSIIFFDELDALAGERSSGPGAPQVQERVLAQLLTELDGVEALGHVIVVGATNRPDRIDPALLRPGRLDRVIYVPLPDLATRIEIFRIRLKKTATSSDVLLYELAEKTEGYSGAEVVAVCNEAALAALDEDINIPEVSKKHFIKALEIILPRTPKIFNKYNFF